jgi:hypothetical protein
MSETSNNQEQYEDDHIKPVSLMRRLEKRKVSNGVRKGDPKPPSWYPSDASATVVIEGASHTYGSCRRSQFLSWLSGAVAYDKVSSKEHECWYELEKAARSVIIPNTPKQEWIFTAGDLHEEHLISEFKQAGIYDSDQVQIYIPPPYNVSGRIDLIGTHEDGTKAIIEVKSCYGPAAESIMGDQTARRNQVIGNPKDNNLMQLALYQYHYAIPREEFGTAELVYGERGNGDTISFGVQVRPDDGAIRYAQILPYESEWVYAPYTVVDILTNYEEQTKRFHSGELPARDFEINYTDQQMFQYVDEAYTVTPEGADKPTSLGDFIKAGGKNRKFELKKKRGVSATINKTVAEQWTKYWDRVTNGGRQVNRPVEGSRKCMWCKYKHFCYSRDGVPLNDNINVKQASPVLHIEAGQPVAISMDPSLLIEDPTLLGLEEAFFD